MGLEFLIAHLHSADPIMATNVFIASLRGSLLNHSCRMGSGRCFHLKKGLTVIFTVEMCRSVSLRWRFPTGAVCCIRGGCRSACRSHHDVHRSGHPAGFVRVVYFMSYCCPKASHLQQLPTLEFLSLEKMDLWSVDDFWLNRFQLDSHFWNWSRPVIFIFLIAFVSQVIIVN